MNFLGSAEEAQALGQNTSNLKEITLCWKEERTKCFFKQYSGHLEIKVRNKIGLHVFPFSVCHFIIIFKNVSLINQK